MRKYLYNLATDKYKGFGPAIFKVILFILSVIYGLIIRCLIIWSQLKTIKLPCKVISVGNITLGGTGKTVIVEFIARYLKEQGHRVAILTRGYGKDEAFMLRSRLKDIPVIIDANRTRGARLAIKKYNVDTVILDDGFQQWHIGKDLDILAIDSKTLFGNRQMIPRGILREPLSSLKRPGVFLMTKFKSQNTEGVKEFLGRVNPKAEIFRSQHKQIGFYRINNPGELLSSEILKNKTVALFSGIADPDSFEDSVKSLNINVGLHLRFPDHHHYSQQDLNNVIKQSLAKNMDTIVTTEKDAAMIGALKKMNYRVKILVLRIELELIDETQGFYNRLLGIYSC